MLHRSHCVLVVIGPGWLSVKDEAGKLRLDNPSDYVRVEVATALRRGIHVIPVLVGGAAMPACARLPDDIKGLVRRQSVEVTSSRWSYDFNGLARSIADYAPGAGLLKYLRQVLTRVSAVGFALGGAAIAAIGALVVWSLIHGALTH